MEVPKSSATIRDVAKLAQTSPATVSRVLRADGYPVTEQLRQRVLAAAEALQYEERPTAAKKIKQPEEEGPCSGSDCKAIGVLLPNTTNPFYQQAMLGIEKVAQSKGYYALTCNTMRNVQREKDYLEVMYRLGIRYIVISPVSSDSSNMLDYKNRGMQFVLLEQKMEGLEASRIHFDMFKGAIIVTQHLLENGHRKIALATTPLTRWTRMQVYNGYKAALEQANIAFDETLVFISSDEHESVEEGYDFLAGKELGDMLAKRAQDFTGIVCVNDITAAGVIVSLKRQGLSIPKDISLVSFDDIPLASMMIPGLTTVRFPTHDAGMLATNLLFDHIEGITKFPLTMKLAPKLVVRETVRPLSEDPS